MLQLQGIQQFHLESVAIIIAMKRGSPKIRGTSCLWDSSKCHVGVPGSKNGRKTLALRNLTIRRKKEGIGHHSEEKGRNRAGACFGLSSGLGM